MIHELFTIEIFWTVFTISLFCLVRLIELIDEKLKRIAEQGNINPSSATIEIENGQLYLVVSYNRMEVIKSLFASEQRDHLGTG